MSLPQKSLQVPAFDICIVGLRVPVTVAGAPAPPGVLQALKIALSMKRPLLWV